MEVPVSGKVVGDLEQYYMKQAVDDLWLTEGRWGKEFAQKLSEFTGMKYVLLCNSGSSANLLAACAAGISKGNTVVTTALNFPTTVNPIIQLGGYPLFIDVTLPNMVADMDQLEQAVKSGPKAVVLAHTLGRPFDTHLVRSICDRNGITMIEDCCDALGTEGTMYGDLVTLSFYPAHHITTGEGGAVLTNNPRLAKLVQSYRDWGRDCWCPTGQDNTCGRRFEGEYDHKYTYSHIGYNLKMTDVAAACGVAQMFRLAMFIASRRNNYWLLHHELEDKRLQDYFEWPKPDDCVSPFGFPLICKPEVDRNELCRWLDAEGVRNRPVFAGNLLNQPAYKDIVYLASDLTRTDIIHKKAFWVGIWPGLERQQLEYTASKLGEYIYG